MTNDQSPRTTVRIDARASIGHWPLGILWSLRHWAFDILLYFVGLLEFSHCCFQICPNRITNRLLVANLRQQLRFARLEEVGHLGLEIFDLLHRHVIEEIVLDGPENCGLNFDRDGIKLRLLEALAHSFAALQIRLRLGAESRAELGKGSQF